MGVTLRRLPARVAEALSAVCAAPLEAGHQGRARCRQGRGAMRGIAVELDKRKVPTPRGGAWRPQLIKRIVQRLGGP
jgi:hypothetical protein